MNLRSAFARMIVSRLAALVLMAAGFAALGGLLPPAAFGHFALALAIYGLADTLVQFGLRQFVIRSETELSRRSIEAGAGLSLAIGGTLCLIGLGAAFALGGGLLPQPVAAALVPLSLVLLVGPFILGTEALLERALRFGLISVMGVVRAGVDVATAVTLALLGFGAPALAWGVMVSHLVTATGLLVFGGSGNRIRPRMGGWGSFVGWGGRLTVIQVLPKLTELGMVAALSAFQGVAVLGLFNRARTIHQLLDRTLLEGIRPVILPAISGALREGQDPRRIYAIKLDYLSAICWPGFALIAMLAGPLVAVLLGPQWDEAVPTVRILALMGLGLPLTKMSQKLFIALDETQAYLRLEFLRDLARLALAIPAAFVSLEAFAAAFVLGNWVKAVGIARYLHRRLGGTGTAHRDSALRAGTMTAATLAGPAAVLAAGFPAPATLLAALPLAAVGWILAAAMVRHPVIVELRDAIGDAARRIRSRSG